LGVSFEICFSVPDRFVFVVFAPHIAVGEKTVWVYELITVNIATICPLHVPSGGPRTDAVTAAHSLENR
jgi:hypothetical protein